MGNYLIIEKEDSAINSILEVLKDFDLHCIGIAKRPDNAMNIILKEAPNLIFFNIDNVVVNSFQFANEINKFQDNISEFIAISSSIEKAYEAMKFGFLDSLIKPLTELEIRKSVLKYQKKKAKPRLKKTICLKSYRDYRYLNTDEILYLKADNNATDFYMKDGNCIGAFKTLKVFEELLPNNFLRIHKSYIINSDYVSRINYGKLLCTVQRNIQKIPFTKTYINNVGIINKTLSESSLVSLN